MARRYWWRSSLSQYSSTALVMIDLGSYPSMGHGGLFWGLRRGTGTGAHETVAERKTNRQSGDISGLVHAGLLLTLLFGAVGTALLAARVHFWSDISSRFQRRCSTKLCTPFICSRSQFPQVYVFRLYVVFWRLSCGLTLSTCSVSPSRCFYSSGR